LKKAEGKKIGRPTKYSASFVTIAKGMCELGATDPQIAEALGVNRYTLQRWRAKYKDFCAALKIGKASADDNVERSLFERAMGYSHEEDKIFLHAGVPVIVKTIKHYPPDPTALIFWLKNRRPEQWREKAKEDEETKETYAKMFAKLLEAMPQ